MTESLKIAEIHRTNIEYERQRHLANWLIKSSPHMAKPSTSVALSTSPSTSKTPPKTQNNKNSDNATATATITQNPLFFLGKCNPGSLSMSRSGIFNSQTNLPLQIVTAAQDGHKPKLRRFNSHDTSANMFSVADFENARLARRNELEMKQRQQQNRYKMNSLSSGGDCSTGDSKGSKFSNDSHPEMLPADIFLDRFSLPRVVRVSTKICFSDETMHSNSSSNGSNSSSSCNINNNSKHNNNNSKDVARTNGELYMLFRHVKNRRMFHGINAKNSATRKKGVIIPQEFQGYFSLVNERGVPMATMYTTLVQLVRERVYKFLSVDNLPAYSESPSSDNLSSRPHYVKGTARGGQIFRLLAVFEDGKQDSNQSSNNSFREKDKGRYAQLLNENRQIVYVSLTTKGKFYEIEPTTPQILQKNAANGSEPTTTTTTATSGATGISIGGGNTAIHKQINPECVHRLNTIIPIDGEIPATVRFIAGPQGSSGFIPETMTITSVSTENVVIGCPIEEPETRSNLMLKKLLVTPEMLCIKTFLGFENEQKLFSNHSIQNILKFCQMNFDSFIRLMEHESITVMKNGSMAAVHKTKSDGLKILKPLNLPKLLRREKSLIAHEREDSIIFLSKSDLENLENKEQQQRDSTTAQKDKLKVFQSTKKKWFRNLKPASKTNSLTSFDLDNIQNKRMSLDRYQDMSKLLQERFGNDSELVVAVEKSEYHGRPSSEIGLEPAREIDQSELRQKSMSLQEVDCRAASRDYNVKPDLLMKVGVAGCSTYNRSDSHKINVIKEQKYCDTQCDDESLVSFTNQQHQQSFITEKLYNEFHVKTKQHSKSSASLQQLLHFSVPQKMNVNETTRKKSSPTCIAADEKPSTTISELRKLNENSIQSMENFDDLPYSNVRDSLVLDANESVSGSTRNRQSSESCSEHHENIYAEICPNELVTITTTTTTSTSAVSDDNDDYLVNGLSCDSNGYNDDGALNNSCRTLRISIATAAACENNAEIIMDRRQADSGNGTMNGSGIRSDQDLNHMGGNLYSSLRY